MKSRVSAIVKRCDDISKAIEDMETYSYQDNIKIVGLPLLTQWKSSEQTAVLCRSLLAALGTKDVSIQDIDMTDRLPARKPSKQPNPISCKFTRPLAKVKVIAVRREVTNLQASNPSSSGVASWIKKVQRSEQLQVLLGWKGMIFSASRRHLKLSSWTRMKTWQHYRTMNERS